MQTQFEFTLPRGYVDGDGTVHRVGTMRLATAMDEIAPLRDARVNANPAYLSVILLARVIVRLGSLADVTPHVIENLFAADMAYLQAFYRRINEEGFTVVRLKCPACEHEFDLDLADLGGA